MGSLWIKSPLGLTGNLRCQEAPAPCYRVDVSRGAQSVVPMAWAGRNVEDLHRWQVLSVAPYFSTWYLVSVYGDVQIILPLWILPQFQRQPPHDWLVCLFCLGRIWICHIGIVFTNMTHGNKAEQRTASRTWNSLQMKSWCGIGSTLFLSMGPYRHYFYPESNLRWHRQAPNQRRRHCATWGRKADAAAQLPAGAGEIRSRHPALRIQVAGLGFLGGWSGSFGSEWGNCSTPSVSVKTLGDGERS